MTISPGTSPILSRILMVLGGLCIVGLTYWFIQTSLAPVPVPPAPPKRGVVQFNTKLDVSKNETFFHLRDLGPIEVKPTNLGRPNPFIPAPVAPTSTVSATTTTVTDQLIVPVTATTTP